MGEYSINNVIAAAKKEDYLPYKQDNQVLLAFIEAKRKGVYGGLVYGSGGTGCSDKTLLKNATLLKQALNHINKPIAELTRDDAIDFRNALTTNTIQAKKYKMVNMQSVQYNQPMTHRTKKTILTTITQFWDFYCEYSRIILKKEVTNIFDKLKLQKPKDTSIEVDYLTPEQMHQLLDTAKDEKSRLLFCLAIDTCARPVELVNLRKKHFIEKDGKLFFKLPEIKGISGKKYLCEALYETAFIRKQLATYNNDDLIFDYIDVNKPFISSQDCFDWNRKKAQHLNLAFKYWCKKTIGKPYTLYCLRKTATMYWLKMSNNNMTWVQQRLGHTAGSSAIKHYMDLQGVATPDQLSQNLDSDKYASVGAEFMQVKDQQLKMQLENQQLKSQMDLMRQQMERMITQQQQFVVVDNRAIAEQLWKMKSEK